MSNQPIPINLRRRLELDLHADDYASLQRAAQLAGLRIEEYVCLLAWRNVDEATPPCEETKSTKRRLALAIHPDDYARIERAADAVGYSLEEYCRLSLHLQSTGILEAPSRPTVAGRAAAMVPQVLSWLTVPSASPDTPLHRAAQTTKVGAPHE